MTNNKINFTIETLNGSGSGMEYTWKAAFMKEISLIMGEGSAKGGTFYDIQFDSYESGI